MNIIQTVEAIAMQIRVEESAKNNYFSEQADFLGLCADIEQELQQRDKKKTVVFYALVEIMRQANFLYYPIDAFISGMVDCYVGKDTRLGFNEFYSSIDRKVETSGLFGKRQELFKEVRSALGDMGELLDQFSLRFNKNMSLEVAYMETFYKQGYETKLTINIVNKDINDKIYAALKKAGANDVLINVANDSDEDEVPTNIVYYPHFKTTNKGVFKVN